MNLSKAHIEKNIEITSDKTEKARYVHLKTALNTLIKNKLVTEENIQFMLTVDLESTISSLKKILENDGKTDVRSPLTRVRRLAELYQSLNNIDYVNLTFSEILLAAVKRKYGDALWLSEVTPESQLQIKKNGKITLREVARDIVLAGVKKDPSLWPKVDLNVYPTIGSASKVVRDYITGASWPAERVSDQRILFLEDFFSLPKNSLLTKVARKIDHNNLGRAQNEKSFSAVNSITFKHKTFSPDLQRVFDEYSAYKINGSQPKLINIPDSLKHSRRYAQRAKVQEINKRTNRWTENALGKNGSKEAFKVNLLTFQDFCITQLNIPFAEVSSNHLTDPEIIMQMIDFSESLQSGASSLVRILNFIKRAVDAQGYLRFCALKGSRTDDDFFEDCDFILEEYKNWVEKAEQGVSQRAGGDAQKGKTNIQFLLSKTATQRKQAVTNASKWLLNKAEGYVVEAKHKKAAIKKATGNVAKENLTKSAASLMRKAIQYARTALIQQISFYNCPRCSNFAALKYYATANKQSKMYASLTFLRQRNKYELFIPKTGSALVSEKQNVRYLKNAHAKKVVDINIELPETLTPLIKKYLEIRDLYVDYDLIPFGMVKDKNEVEAMFPWRSNRESHINIENNKELRAAFIEIPSKLSDNFRHLTYQAYFYTMPEEKQHGINIHAMRHLVAETHLDEHPGVFIGAAAKLNDDVEQIINTYGDKDRSKAMRRVATYNDDDLVVI